MSSCLHSVGQSNSAINASNQMPTLRLIFKATKSKADGIVIKLVKIPACPCQVLEDIRCCTVSLTSVAIVEFHNVVRDQLLVNPLPPSRSLLYPRTLSLPATTTWERIRRLQQKGEEPRTICSRCRTYFHIQVWLSTKEMEPGYLE